MGDTHKHEGVLTSKGTLRSHPISRAHGDFKVQRLHDLELGPINKIVKKKVVKKKVVCPVEPPKKNAKKLEFPVDNEGYVCIDLSNTNAKGLRIKFERVEGSKKRTVGLQIEK